ncbi:MAG: alpha/beta hydrolase, partial [Solirubrobacteraceae bacterium]
MLVVGKSMASLLAGEVADRDLPAVWLTPLLNETAGIDGLARSRRAVLLIGGDDDPTWRPAAVAHHPALQAIEVPGADHSLQVPGDLRPSVDALARLV